MRSAAQLCAKLFAAQTMMRRADSDANSLLDAEEFARYMHAREKKLKVVFSGLDKDDDGK